MTTVDEPIPSGGEPPSFVDDELELAVFSADNTRQTLRASVQDVWKFRSFISYMTKRDLRTTYLRSYLGWVWSLINPIAEIAIYSLVFGVILAVNRRLPDAPGGFESFPHYLISGMVIWNFYRATSSKVLNSFTSTVKLRRKLYFPPVAPAISQALTVLVQNSLEIGALVLFYLFWGHVSIKMLVLVPVALLATAAGLGVGLLLSVANSRYRDVGYLYSIFLRLFFYLIPIIWSIEFVEDRIGLEWLVPIVRWNPFAKMIEVSRAGTYVHEWPPLVDWAWIGGWSIGLLLLGWTVFARSSADVAEGST